MPCALEQQRILDDPESTKTPRLLPELNDFFRRLPTAEKNVHYLGLNGQTPKQYPKQR